MTYTIDELRNYLLGSEYAGPGLLRRVAERVEEMSSGYGPAGSSWPFIAPGSIGSVIGIGSGQKAEDSESIESAFELAAFLVGWMGGGETSARATRDLLTYLRRNQISDVDYLLGVNEGTGERDAGRIAMVREQVRLLLSPDAPNIASVHRCESLARYIAGWMGACEHDFHEVPSDLRHVQVFQCGCGASYQVYEGDSRWIAV